MTLSELIAQLQQVQAEHGPDLPVVAGRYGHHAEPAVKVRPAWELFDDVPADGRLCVQLSGREWLDSRGTPIPLCG